MTQLLYIKKYSPEVFDAKTIENIEKHYNSTYVGDFAIHQKGQWTERPVAVFYQPSPDLSKGHKHYFGMYMNGGSPFITDASSAAEKPFEGVIADNGEVIYSRHRHDFNESSDKTVYIDGGRDYTRSNTGRIIQLHITAGRIELV